MNRNIQIINIYTICCHMVFGLPVLVPYYETIGLSFHDFLIGEAVFAAIVLLAEVPSGWIADVWKRRTALIFGLVFGIAGYSGLMISTEFWHTVVSQGIIGVAVAMNSGTVTAMLYDSLQESGRVDDYRRLDGKRHAFSLYSVAFAALIGGFAFQIHPKLPLFMEIVVLVVGMIAMSFAVEPQRHMKSVERHALHDIKETMRYAFRGHPEITGIILVSTVMFCASKLMLWAQQPFYQQAGIPVEWFGVIMTGSYIVAGAAGHWSHKIEHLGSNRMALGIMSGAMMLACIIMAAVPNGGLAIALFMSGTLAYAIGQPRVNNAINSRVGSERRATILSTAGLMPSVLFIPTSLVMGSIADHGGIQIALLYLGGQILVLGAIGLWLWGRNDYAASSSITGT